MLVANAVFKNLLFPPTGSQPANFAQFLMPSFECEAQPLLVDALLLAGSR